MRKHLMALAVTTVFAVWPAMNALAQDNAPDRHVYFGDLHLHTELSLDAWTGFGTKTTPDQAYKFAKGETVDWWGRPAKRTWPLDFMAVTDHSEMMGVYMQLDDPNSSFAKSDLGKQIIQKPDYGIYLVQQAMQKKVDLSALNVKGAEQNAWDIVVKAANDNYEPGKFTTFVAYEWTSFAQGKYNLHRNVIFNSDHAPMPFSSQDSDRPEDLWTYLESVRAHGIDVIAIPHNGNASGGLMYDWNNSDGKPIDEVYAQRRERNEPLTEIAQNKGQSDTVPELSANDEFANFELWERLILSTTERSEPNGSYIRQALGRGLVIEEKVGTNPFKYGIVGATDIHNGLSTSDENAMGGWFYGIDPNTTLPEDDFARRMLGLTTAIPRNLPPGGRGPAPQAKPEMFSSGGLTGVWAEANDRNSIFAALKRKETFGTSGPRMRLRFFGGWNYDQKMVDGANWPASAYVGGVAMGSDLPQRFTSAQAPTFVAWAMKDPDSGNLDRIQIIKLFLVNGDYKEKIFDVAYAGKREPDPKSGKLPPIGNTVDLKTATYTNTIGAAQLSAVWRDPQFDALKPAVYYVRVLEIPTPRWSTLLAAKRNLPLPGDEPATIQERGWSSPIWYTPAGFGKKHDG